MVASRAKRPLSPAVDTAKSGGGDREQDQASGSTDGEKLDLKVMEDLYATMLAAYQADEMPPFVTEMGKHIQSLKDAANRQTAAIVG